MSLLKKLVRKTFTTHCVIGLYMLTFHKLDHLPENGRRLDAHGQLCISDFDPLNAQVKRAYTAAWRQHSSSVEKTLCMIKEQWGMELPVDFVSVKNRYSCGMKNKRRQHEKGPSLGRRNRRVAL